MLASIPPPPSAHAAAHAHARADSPPLVPPRRPGTSAAAATAGRRAAWSVDPAAADWSDATTPFIHQHQQQQHHQHADSNAGQYTSPWSQSVSERLSACICMTLPHNRFLVKYNRPM